VVKIFVVSSSNLPTYCWEKYKASALVVIKGFRALESHFERSSLSEYKSR